MGSWVFGQLVIGNLRNGDRKTGLKGCSFGRTNLVTKVVYRDLLINKLIPAILDKWTRGDRMSRTIYIQQDGATNHIHEDDEEFNNSLTEQDINTKLYTQMPNSPGVNLFDLGFFRAIQSFNDASPKNEAELIQSVQDAFENYLRHKLNWMWLTLQSYFNQNINIMETTTTVLNISRKKDWNDRGNCRTYWMWWMMTSTKRTTKRMTKATTIATHRKTTEKKHLK